MKEKKKVLKYLILSLFALIIIFIINYFTQSNIVTFIDKLIVGIVFIISLIFGITVAIKPAWYKKKKNQKKDNTNKFSSHHPDCKRFKDHKISIKNKTYCAGCLGLIIGSIITIILIIYYLIFDLINLNNYFFLLTGLLLIIFLFIFTTFFKRKPIIRVVTNIIFIISFFIIVINTLEITGSWTYALLTGLFCFLFVDTRIQISKWSHEKTCYECKSDCKMY